MFNKKQKEIDTLKRILETVEAHNASLVAQMDSMVGKTPVDLTRECLKILPLDINFDGGDPKYTSNTYLNNLAALADNSTLEEEIKKIAWEDLQYIGTESPDTPTANLLSRGEISGVVKLFQRAKEARSFLEYKKGNDTDEV